MFKRILVIISILLFSLFFIGGCRKAGGWLVLVKEPAHADAILLLMGNFPERVMEAVDLYKENRAGRIIIVQESMGPYYLLETRGADILSTTEQAYNSAVTLGIPEDSIKVLPGDARSTMDEAVIMSTYLEGKPEIDTVILVSSPAHMRRASIIFKAVFKSKKIPVFIGCIPSRYSNFQPEKWWRRKEDIQMVLTEFVKMGSFLFFEKRDLE